MHVAGGGLISSFLCLLPQKKVKNEVSVVLDDIYHFVRRNRVCLVDVGKGDSLGVGVSVHWILTP